MLEIVIFVVIVIVVIVTIFIFSSFRGKAEITIYEDKVSSAKDRIKIAERRFMQGKIKKSVFESLMQELEEDLLSAEMYLLRLKKSDSLSVSNKSAQIVAKISRPTRRKERIIESILKETELLRLEMSLLEGRFLKREIKQSVFENLIKKKERELIQKEKELMDVVSDSKK